MIIVKTHTSKIDLSTTLFAAIASSYKLLKTVRNWLVKEKLGHVPALLMLSFLLLFQFSLYEYDVDEYFTMASKDESVIAEIM